MLAEYLGVLIIFAIAVAVARGVLATGGSAGLGRSSDEKQSSRPRSAVQLQPVALLLLLLSVVVVFVYPWAASFRELGSTGLLGLGVFCAPIGVGFAYLWRRGALEW
jgi:NADH-quinone oxidoreductase subunit A